MKTVGGFRRTRYRGLDRTGLAGYLVGTAYNLVRMARLITAETPAPQATLAAPAVTGPESGASAAGQTTQVTPHPTTWRQCQQPSQRHETLSSAAC